MKTRVPIAAATGVGCLVSFWLFGLAFNLSIEEFNRAAIEPLLVAFIAPLIFVGICPRALQGIARGTALPTLLVNGFLFLGVLLEGRGPAWGHLATALKVVVAALLGSACGLVASRLIHGRSEG